MTKKNDNKVHKTINRSPHFELISTSTCLNIKLCLHRHNKKLMFVCSTIQKNMFVNRIFDALKNENLESKLNAVK